VKDKKLSHILGKDTLQEALKKLHGHASLDIFKEEQKRINNLIQNSVADALKMQQQLESLSSYAVINGIKEQQERLNTNFSAIEALKTQQEQLKLLSRYSTAGILEEQQKKLIEIYKSPTVTILKEQQEKLSYAYSSIGLDFIKEQQQKLSNIITSPALIEIKIQHDRWKSIFKSPTIEAFNLAREVLASNSDLALTISPAFIEETINLVEDFYSNEENQQSDPVISVEGYINLFFAIILSLLTYIAALESEENLVGRIGQLSGSVQENNESLLERVGELESKVLEQLSNLSSATDEDENTVYYIVRRTVKLRSQSNTGKESAIIDMLYPNQKVKLLKRNRKWIYISFFDYISGIQRNGWVYKKYLFMEKPLKNPKEKTVIEIIEQEQILTLSQKDAELVVSALEAPSQMHKKLQKAAQRYDKEKKA